MQHTIQDGFNTVEYGTVVYKSYPLLDDVLENIHYIQVPCTSCTTTFVDFDKKSISISLDTTKVGAVKGELKSIHKTITVWLGKDVPHFIADDNLLMINNSQKDSIIYILSGFVE